MGNDVHIKYGRKKIANLGRKYNFTLYGYDRLPESDEINERKKKIRAEIMFHTGIICGTTDGQLVNNAADKLKELFDEMEFIIEIQVRVQMLKNIAENPLCSIHDDFGKIL